MPISLEVWGDYALFTRPEMKVERVSYDVMTPSAARGLIEAIYWHPVLLCKQAAKIFQTICKKETALKRVLRNLLSAISFAQI